MLVDEKIKELIRIYERDIDNMKRKEIEPMVFLFLNLSPNFYNIRTKKYKIMKQI